MSDSNQIYGGLTEGVHIAGYSLERALQNLEWLLEKDRWRSVGKGFDNVNDFMGTINLQGFKVIADQRLKLAKRIKELQPEVSNRSVAKLLGVNHQTINNDLGYNSPVVDGASAAKIVKRREDIPAKREERLEKLAEISKGNTELDTSQRYPIIYADPPWRYENPPIGATNRAIENHYPTMSLEEICALPVSDLATDDAMLYLWATAPKLSECMQVIVAWGFEYRTNIVWDKEVIGMGYHARNQHEILLIAKRGNIPPPLAGKQPSSVHREKRAEHSVKPEFYYEMIEAAYPQLPKIELFCRSPRLGWESWGNQAEAA